MGSPTFHFARGQRIP